MKQRKNIQGTKSVGKETGTQIYDLEQKEEINIQAEDGIRDQDACLVGSEMCIRDRSDEEIANLSDAEFKTLVIRMLTGMVKYGHKIKEEVKAMQSEIKENV